MQYEYQVDKGLTYAIYPPFCSSLTLHSTWKKPYYYDR